MAKKERVQSSVIGQKIKRLREGNKWSLSKLAKQAGISRSYIYQIESGLSSPTEDKLRNIANAFGITLSDLLEEEKPMGSELNIPQSLKNFAAKENLPSADIEMLAKLMYRGKQPTTEDQWRFLYRAIKLTLENGS